MPTRESFADAMALTASAEDAVRKAYGHVKYTGKSCPNCGRERLEQCSNGKVICEKCHWEPAAGGYNADHLELFR